MEDYDINHHGRTPRGQGFWAGASVCDCVACCYRCICSSRYCFNVMPGMLIDARKSSTSLILPIGKACRRRLSYYMVKPPIDFSIILRLLFYYSAKGRNLEKTLGKQKGVRGRIINLRLDSVPLNSNTAMREWLNTRGSGDCCPKENGDKLVKQYRRRWSRCCWNCLRKLSRVNRTAPPGTNREQDYRRDLRYLVSFYTSPGFQASMHMFLATRRSEKYRTTTRWWRRLK